ncbi:MAG: phBC6A51 family helix-turn-helix protein [Bacillota bacterium]
MGLTRLSDEHYHAIELLAQPKDKRMTNDAIAKEVGCHRNSIYNWLKDPLFQKEYKRIVSSVRLKRLGDVIDAVIDAAIEDKNAASQKLFLQYQEVLGGSDVQVNVNNRQEYSKEMLEELRKNIAMNKSDKNDGEVEKE